MATVRAKFRCEAASPPAEDGTRNYTFGAVVSDDPANPNHAFWKYTPAGQLTMSCCNPAVQFEAGKDYFLDFVPVEEG